MSDQKKPEAIEDEDLDGAQGGLFSTHGAGNELYSTSSAGTELYSTSGAGTELFSTHGMGTEVRAGQRSKRPGRNMEVVNEDE